MEIKQFVKRIIQQDMFADLEDLLRRRVIAFSTRLIKILFNKIEE